jgi:lysophospholipase L1-like esterase
MERTTFRAARAAAAALAIALAFSGAARADVYLSLGDSLGFGEGAAPTTASYGTDQGYVGLYAAYLAAQNGGVAPTVLNLSIPGETSSSFAAGSGRIGPDNQPPSAAEDAVLVALNKNYTDYAAAHGGTVPAQQDLLAEKLATYGASITHVTISLGSNDLFKLVLTDPNPAADLPAALGAFAASYAAILTEILTASPGAHITLVGSYDPFPAGTPGPVAALAGPAIAALNQTIGMLADNFHVGFADPAPLFVGNELAYTYIWDNGNVHPNATGYGVIAGAIEAVPEPSSLALTAVGIAGWAAARRSRRRTVAAA